MIQKLLWQIFVWKSHTQKCGNLLLIYLIFQIIYKGRKHFLYIHF